MNQEFHDHLDACEQCRNHPMHLCPRGVVLLHGEARAVAPAEPMCEHGTAMDVHCCNCHSGFLFDSNACVCTFDESKPSDGAYLWERCYACGHRLRFASTGCPQCSMTFDGREDPPAWPERCDCERCSTARRPQETT